MSENGSNNSKGTNLPVPGWMQGPLGEGCAHVWDKVFHTDPTFTKEFSHGGFSGTAVTPTYLVQKATKLFGPMGLGWGCTIVSEEILEGSPLGWDDNGNSWGRELIHKLRVRFWYEMEWRGEIRRGEIEQFGQTTFVGRTGHGVFTDEEAPKKSFTDGMSKCMSLLGFGADVHMNLFSDVKYLEGLHAKFGSPARGPGLTDTPPPGASGVDAAPARQRASAQSQQADSAKSDRYTMYKTRLDDQNQKIADVAIARQTVEQDAGLTKVESALLLSHPRLQLTQQSPKDEIFL
ncbi:MULTISPECIES: hypothetical protein [Cupriavidus]|uniref:hypothetical protein n=1 Tax=Cupriavidus TaxID=106589 RepID=UPI0011EC8811|nr:MULTISPECIES: hypothetical protein [Cupriavidus]MWL91846.1 hypothetical protein [Cupriavidus sp. SW-Y-13]